MLISICLNSHKSFPLERVSFRVPNRGFYEISVKDPTRQIVPDTCSCYWTFERLFWSFAFLRVEGENTNGRCIHTQLSTTDQRRSLFLRNPEGNKDKISAADNSMSRSEVSTQHPAKSKCAAIIDHCSSSALKWSVVSMRKWSLAGLLWLVAGKTGVPFHLGLSNGHANPKAKTV